MARIKKTEVSEAVAVPTTTVFPIDALMPSTGRMEVIHPIKLEPTSAWVELAGVDSDEFTAAMYSVVQRNAKIDETKLDDSQKAVMAENIRRELAARCIVGWDESYFGPFSLERSAQLLTKLKWLYVQVEKFLDDRENFYKV